MAGPIDEQPTDDVIVSPWQQPPNTGEREVLHLVIGWFVNDPGLTGFVARMDRSCWLGRGEPGSGDTPRMEFTQQRPSLFYRAPGFTSTAISRRQLTFTPVDETAVRVECVGRRALYHNGGRVTECVVKAGDTLMLEGTAVFVVERRAPHLPALRHYPAPQFWFGKPDPQGLVGESPIPWSLRDALAAAAASREHVLLLGPSGAGKELAASAIHALSSRRDGKFVARNAATMPASLLDAELFGTARNYPNPGSPERQGLIGAADGGTLLLDEIGELPEEHQAHLLRALDRHGEYHRLGESQARQSDFRLIGATNRGVEALKHDFLARFTTRIEVPGLDERRSDIPFLIAELLRRMACQSPHIAKQFCTDEDPAQPRIAPTLYEALLRHRYTTHLRELERWLRVSVTSSPGEYLAKTPEVCRALDGAGEASQDERQTTRETVLDALNAANGSFTKAGELLGLSRYVVRRLVKRYGIESRK